jgi:hypothetical protein
MSKATYARQTIPTVWVSAIFTGLLALIALSFPKYFLIDPSPTNSTLAAFQISYNVSFLIIALVPPVVLTIAPTLNRTLKILLISSVSIFPVSIIATHLTLAATQGKPYLDYLAVYPILFVSHLVIPAAYILIFAATKTNE